MYIYVTFTLRLFDYFVTTLLIVKTVQNMYQALFQSMPGPWGFPVLGHLPLLGKNPAQYLFDMSKTYGDIFMIRMGSWPTIILNKRELIREAIIDNQDVFSDRPDFLNAIVLKRSLGFGNYTPRWKIHRKIANHVLRHFVTGKFNHTEEIINSEAAIVVESFIKTKGERFNPHDDIFNAVGSIIFQLCFGSSKNCRQNEVFVNFVNDTNVFVEATGAGSPVEVLPWLRYVMSWKVKQFEKTVELNRTLISQQATDHVVSYNINDHRDICDRLMAAAEEYGNAPEVNDGLTKQDILSTLTDFMGAGFDTVSTTLEWLILYLAHHHDVQKRVQSEIDNVIGSRKATFKDKRDLPFTEATLLEVIRIANVVPMGVPHATSSDTVFHDYTIKKGTVVFCNFYATSRDEKIWDDPCKFNPDRFLDENNEVHVIQEKVDNVPTFGMGRRRCPGEPLAKTELFLFAVNIFQRCKFYLVSEPNFEPVFGLTYDEIVVSAR